MPQQLASMMVPVLALCVWTFVMWTWMYATRIPAMRKARIDIARLKGRETHGEFAKVPAKVHWVADNYNHLHEQPTVFFALCIYSHLVGVQDEANIYLAWAYVALRVIHSFVQVTSNFVPARFVLFVASTLVLMAIAARNVWALAASPAVAAA